MMDDDQEQRFEPLHYVLPGVSSPLPTLHLASPPSQALFEKKLQAPTPVERRLLQWNSFAMQCCRLSGNKDTNSWTLKTSKPVGDYLAAEPPYIVSVSDINIGSAFGSMPYSQTLRVLNASVVGLCYSENTSQDAGNLLPCLGLGIVRSIDVSSNKLYILTPLDITTVQRVTHLLVGKLELPSSLLQTETFKSPYLALHAMASEGTGAGAGKSRNNLLRLSQLSGV
jgi:polynucleotide 5'-hydroxyl-kinase GRC3/NOL9